VESNYLFDRYGTVDPYKLEKDYDFAYIFATSSAIIDQINNCCELIEKKSNV